MESHISSIMSTNLDGNATDFNGVGSVGERIISLTSDLSGYYANQKVNVPQLVTNESAPLIRYIRLNPHYNQLETLTLLGEEIKATFGSNLDPRFRRVTWLNEKLNFYAVPGLFSLQKSHLFRSGRVYGMDVNSGAAVAVLLSSQYDDDNNDTASTQPTILDNHSPSPGNEHSDRFRVLDLCCAPGLKLCAIADLIAGSERRFKEVQIVGVDVSESRLAVCKRIIAKYQTEPKSTVDDDGIRLQLYCGDGRVFGTKGQELDLQFDSIAEAEANLFDKHERKRKNKSARARERKRLRQLANDEITSSSAKVYGHNGALSASTSSSDPTELVVQQFDRVLVDAECSTDGSLKHILKRSSKPGQKAKNNETLTSLPSLTDRDELSKLVDLQRNLILSGFRLLKAGGFMVYSTCSLCQDQNEQVVSWLLQTFPNEAYLVPVKFPGIGGGDLIANGSLAGTIRFQPNPQAFEPQAVGTLQTHFACANLYGEGFFLAKIGKKQFTPTAPHVAS